jgi:hypothetical protein
MEEVDDLIRRTHKKIWCDWHGDDTPYRQAKLIITHNKNGAYYDKTKDEIHVDVPDGNLSDTDILDPDAWPVWKVDLIEEMVHETQHKVPKSVAAFIKEGQQLCAEYSGYFDGDGHDATFFAGVAKYASYFGLTAERLVSALRGQMVPRYPRLPTS